MVLNRIRVFQSQGPQPKILSDRSGRAFRPNDGLPESWSRMNGGTGANGWLGIGADQGMWMVACEVFVPLERIKDDWTERGPPGK